MGRRPSVLTIALVASSAYTGCSEQATVKTTRVSGASVNHDSIVQRHREQAERLNQSVAFTAEPLRSLNPEQQASLAALLLITRMTAQNELVGSPVSVDAAANLWTKLGDVCPPLRSVNLSRGDCIDETIAYLTAAKECANKENAEERRRCEGLLGPEEGALAACQMKQLEALVVAIRGLPGRRWPPGPQPWPIGPTGAVGTTPK